MDTAPLKSFATWARTDLIAEVSAGIRRVLAPASPERVEQPGVVADLEKAISAAGGGETGRAAVADKVAYTWFNRIVALRFMDANGYTGIGVVSPARGQAGGQPEILAEAKRGTIDTTVVTNKSTVETVTGLLDGTRRSDDPQGEAYALLLAEYCRYWNRAMPFMFEREGDYTELLIPANLLADDSVLARAVATLTEDVCQDVEVIGWLYQFYISERKDEVFAGFKKNKKAGAAEIPAATQLFTPHWIVRYLVENSLGRLWLLNRPTSRLAGQMEYYIKPVDEETDHLKITSPEELKVIDPACGSGHMLTYAFDLLYAIYQEEGYAPADIPSLILTHNLYGVEIDPRAGALAAFALTMKARAKQRTFFTKQVQPNVCVLEPIKFTPPELDLLVTPDGDRAAEEAFWNTFEHADTFGSLIRPRADLIEPLSRRLGDGEGSGTDLLVRDLRERARRVIKQAAYLTPRYSVAVANPPYMGSRNMSVELTGWLKVHYDSVRSDLFSSFFVRSLELVRPKGQLGFMSPFVWMFVSSYRSLREIIVREQTITSLIQLEYSGFEGATVPICAFTFQQGHSPFKGAFIRLSDFVGPRIQPIKAKEAILAGVAQERGIESPFPGMESHFYRTAAAEFRKFPTSTIGYWISPTIRDLFATRRSMGDIALFTGSLNKTGDNGRYVRKTWEVSRSSIGRGCKWVPYTKGGGQRRWYGLVTDVVDWSPEARSFYKSNPGSNLLAADRWYMPGITYSMITSATNTFRYLPEGAVFDMGGPAFHPHAGSSEIALAVANSSLSPLILDLLNPTLNLQMSDVKRLPVPNLSQTQAIEIESLVQAAVDIATRDWNGQELSHQFSGLQFVATGHRKASEAVREDIESAREKVATLSRAEQRINEIVADSLGVSSDVETSVDPSSVMIFANPHYRLGAEGVKESGQISARIADLVSYAVGCMFGRYSLDEPGLILANQGETLQDYLASVPNPSFLPDRDNVLPIVDGDWFEDDIVTRFRLFLRVAFGEDHFEENLRFVTEALGVKDLRDYFVKSFYKDHVQRYKKRPIYWLFSSPKGSFNALIYMHRYTPSTVSTVLNEYLREFRAKLEASRQHHERLAAGGGTPRQQAAALKEVDRLRKVLLELEEYEHDVLYPLATRQVDIDLDDGVKANYPKFGAALKKIPGLEASDE